MNLLVHTLTDLSGHELEGHNHPPLQQPATPESSLTGNLATAEQGSVMKSFAIGCAAAALGFVTLVSPAQAMGSSDAYENIQVGVTYTVYEPSFTAGLKATHIGGNDLCQAGTEENVSSRYGKSNGRQFMITEGNPMCSDIGVGQTVLTTSIGGAQAVL